VGAATDVGRVPTVTAARIGPIHHVAVVVRSIDESLPRYRVLFGLEPDAEPRVFTSQRVRLAFLSTGPAPAARIELVEPIDDESGVARYLASHGEGVHHVCFTTDDLPAALDALAAREAELIDREPRAGAHGTVAFVHPRTLNGVLWELLEGAPRGADVERA
jgi:methylmalonyl-CoA/ethylmalonyl-CoA epimerase